MTSEANQFIAEVRANLLKPDWTHDMSESDWIELTEKLLDLAAEYVWLREESES